MKNRILRGIFCCLTVFALASCANSGRYSGIQTKMYGCGFNTAPFHQFHDCMKDKVTVSDSDTHDYYWRTANEYRSLIDDLDNQVQKKKLKQNEAYARLQGYVGEKIIEERKSAQTVSAVLAVAAVGAAAASCAHNGNCGGGGNADYRGCCSWHVGMAGVCAPDHHQLCNDGQSSPSCMCP